MTNSFGEFENAKLFFLIGTNMSEAHPVASYFVKRAVNKGATLIVVDPRKHLLAKKADIFAQIKVGSDVAFLNGIMHVLITEGLYDKEFVAANCEDFEALKATVMMYPPERASQISGVSVEVIQQIARTMARRDRGWPAIRLASRSTPAARTTSCQYPTSSCCSATSGWRIAV